MVSRSTSNISIEIRPATIRAAGPCHKRSFPNWYLGFRESGLISAVSAWGWTALVSFGLNDVIPWVLVRGLFHG